MEPLGTKNHLRALLDVRNELDSKILDVKNSLHIKSSREKHLTAEELRKFVDYDPETGHFTLKKAKWGKKRYGDRVGCIRGDGYRDIRINKICFMEHRLAFLYMTGEWPKFIVNHINEIKTDNRWCNLQHVTWSLNNLNRRLHVHNKSGHKGVSLHQGGRWRASLVVNNRQVYHKLFSTKEEAIAAYEIAFKKYWGFPMSEVSSAVVN